MNSKNIAKRLEVFKSKRLDFNVEKYFPEIKIPYVKNYNYALTTLPYVIEYNPPVFNLETTPAKEYKDYNQRFNIPQTVGKLPRQLSNYMKYCE